MAVFVTGGTGYLGQALVRSLRARGKEVRALVRPESDTRALDPERLEMVLGNIRDPASVRSGVSGCRAVVHAAALTDPTARRRELEATNVQGFRNVMDAAYRAKVPIVVHLSSFLAIGPSWGALADEDHLGAPRRSATEYERTKMVADRLTGSYISGGLPLCVVYPTIVYGPGPVRGSNLVSRLVIDRAQGRLGAIPTDGEQRWSLAYIDDVAEGVCKALERGRPGDRFILGGENAPVFELFRILEEVSGLTAPRRKGSLVGAGARARFSDWSSRLIGRSPMSPRLTLDLMRHDWAYSSARAEERLGYTIRPLNDGVKRTVEYLVRKGLLS